MKTTGTAIVYLNECKHEFKMAVTEKDAWCHDCGALFFVDDLGDGIWMTPNDIRRARGEDCLPRGGRFE